MSVTTPILAPLEKIERDVKQASITLGRDEARFLVDTYYQLQDFRIASSNQVRSIMQAGKHEPHETLSFFGQQFVTLEKQIAGALDTYSNSHDLGKWARENVGVGPVITAGLLAHIDVTKTTSASSLWRFAGLMPGQRKQKGVKRDWNSNLKVLCWKIGDSFVKFSGKENCYYGHLYRQRKATEIARNEAVVIAPESELVPLRSAGYDVSGELSDWPTMLWDLEKPTLAVKLGGEWRAGGNSEVAARTLATTNIQEKTTRNRYEEGKLPDGRIDARARRYAVKRFLLHYWECAWWLHYGTEPRDAYVHEHLGHVHKEAPPVPYPKP